MKYEQVLSSHPKGYLHPYTMVFIDHFHTATWILSSIFLNHYILHPMQSIFIHTAAFIFFGVLTLLIHDITAEVAFSLIHWMIGFSLSFVVSYGTYILRLGITRTRNMLPTTYFKSYSTIPKSATSKLYAHEMLLTICWISLYLITIISYDWVLKWLQPKEFIWAFLLFGGVYGILLFAILFFMHYSIIYRAIHSTADITDTFSNLSFSQIFLISIGIPLYASAGLLWTIWGFDNSSVNINTYLAHLIGYITYIIVMIFIIIGVTILFKAYYIYYGSQHTKKKTNVPLLNPRTIQFDDTKSGTIQSDIQLLQMTFA